MPGVAAKPVIDMIAPVRDLEAARGVGAGSPYATDKFKFVARVLAGAGINLKEDDDRLSPAAFAERRR